MIDLHSHLLPGIDDGPGTLEEAIAMAEAWVAAGVDTVAATPHVNPHYPNTPETIAAALARTERALADAAIPLRVVAGAEIDLQYGLDLDDATLHALALHEGPWLLIESPHQLHPRVEVALGELSVRGHRVLLAHPERSPVFMRDRASLRRLVDAGLRTQITAGSLTGQFGRTVQRHAEELLDAGLVHTVASDAHNLQRRPPSLHAQALQPALGARWTTLSEEAPRAILAGEEVPAAATARRRERTRGARRHWWTRSQAGEEGR